VLKLVDIRGAIITIDAMGTQKAIAKAIVNGGADYVLALKGNQESLHDAVVAYVDAQLQTDFANIGARRHLTREKGHGREGIRHYVQMPAPKTLPGFGLWTGLLTIGVAMLSCVRDGKETADIRYFISSLPMGVQRFAHAVRSHWSIENTCHWSLDLTYREDESPSARSTPARELRMNESLHLISPKTTPRQSQPRHETTLLRLGR
jgi:predicted transposase YbfD/YdcC